MIPFDPPTVKAFFSNFVPGWARAGQLFSKFAGGTAGQVLKKNSDADGDFVWGTGGGGSGDPGTPPTVVQSAANVAGTDSVTLGVAPTSGNLLVAMSFNPTTDSPGTGWTKVADNSTGTDYGVVLTKVAGGSESTTQTPLGATAGGTGAIVIWEIEAPVSVLLAQSEVENFGLSGVTPVAPNLKDCLALMAIGLVSASNNIKTAFNVTVDQLIKVGTTRQIAAGHSDLTVSPLAQELVSFDGTDTPGSKGCLIILTSA